MTAHASADGTGTALAAGSVEVDVPEGAISGQGVTLNTSVTEVRVMPAAANVAIGDAVRLTASAFDAQGNMVVIRPDQWQWSIAPGTIASIAPAGDTAQVTGLVRGVAIASVVLPEAGLSASKNVTVGQPGAGTLPLYLQAKPDGHGVLHIETSLGFTAQSNSATHSFDVTNRPGRVLVSIWGKDHDSDGSLGVGSIPLLNVTETGFDTSTDDRTATGPGTVSYDPALGGTMSLTMTFTRTDSEPFRQVFTYTTKLLPLGQ